MASLDVATNKLEELIHRQAINILEKPLLTTLVTSCVLLLLISAITISTLITAGVLCIVVVILIIEGEKLNLSTNPMISIILIGSIYSCM